MSDDFICPEREKLTTIEELTQHDWIICDKCHRIRVRAKLDSDKEILFPDGDPPWKKYFDSQNLPEKIPVEENSEPEEHQLQESPQQGLHIDLFQPIQPIVQKETPQSSPSQNRLEEQPFQREQQLIDQPSRENLASTSSSSQSIPFMHKKKFQQREKKEKFVPSNLRDKLLVRDLTKLEGIDKAAAVEKLLQKRLEDAKKSEPKQKEKTVVDPNQMAWNPQMGKNSNSAVFMLPKGAQSALSFEVHRRYVAILSNFLTPQGKTRFVFNDIDLKNMDNKLAKEREEFNHLVIKRNSYVDRFQGSPYRYLLPGSLDYVKSRILAKLSTLSPNGYYYVKSRILAKLSTLSPNGYCKVVKELQWSIKEEAEECLAYPKRLSLLREGGIGEKFQIPDVRRKCVFSLSASDISTAFPPDKAIEDPIEDDKMALEMSADNGVEVVMNACTVRHFLTAPWPNRSEDHILKVTVRRHIHQGKIIRVCFVGKPITASTLNKMTCMRMFMKYVVKNGIRKPEPKETISKRVPSYMRKRQLDKQQSKTFQPALKQMKLDSEPGNLMIAESDDDPKSPEPQKITQEKSSKKWPSPKKEFPSEGHDASNDLLSGILGGMNAFAGITEKEKSKEQFNVTDLLDFPFSQEQADEASPKSKRYAIFSFDAKENKRILIRSTTHGIDQQKNSVAITSKVEYVPNCGAEKMTNEETLWNAITAVLKGAEHHLNFYMRFEEGDCLQLVRRNARESFHLQPEEKKLLSQRSDRLCSLIDTLHELDFGEHLILQSNEKLKFFQEADQNETEVTMTRENIEHMLFDGEGEPLEFAKAFQGIDPHLVLVWHIIQSRIPGSFLPFKGEAKKIHPSPAKGSPSAKRRARRSRLHQKKENEQGGNESNVDVLSTSTKDSSPEKKPEVKKSNFRGGYRGHESRGNWRWGRGNRGSRGRGSQDNKRGGFVPVDWDTPESLL
uniref:Little elongation complex subunit 2 C-terminal domain-containing protein n=1 Tax=Acrobeloides nanus TaxID=290746 RepID=A0A914C1L1_9BILA